MDLQADGHHSMCCGAPCWCMQTRNIMLLILCGASLTMPLLGVISSFVLTHDQGIALW